MVPYYLGDLKGTLIWRTTLIIKGSFFGSERGFGRWGSKESELCTSKNKPRCRKPKPVQIWFLFRNLLKSYRYIVRFPDYADLSYPFATNTGSSWHAASNFAAARFKVVSRV